jgi:hypothetical protein
LNQVFHFKILIGLATILFAYSVTASRRVGDF